jgi:hypothetical protein
VDHRAAGLWRPQQQNGSRECDKVMTLLYTSSGRGQVLRFELVEHGEDLTGEVAFEFPESSSGGEALVTRAAVGVASIDQPTTRREQASRTTAQ